MIRLRFKDYFILVESGASDAASQALQRMGYGNASLANLQKRPESSPTLSGDDTQLAEPEKRRILNRPVYRMPQAAPQARPQPVQRPSIDDRVQNPWPTNQQVNNFTPKQGEFGFGKRTPDFYSQAAKTVSPNYKAKYNQYQPTPEEQQEILKIYQTNPGITPLGIMLKLGDTGKRIPAHAIQTILKGQSR